jgi:two-component system response regulator GlrR
MPWKLVIIGRADSSLEHCLKALQDRIPLLVCRQVGWEALLRGPGGAPAADLTLLLATDAMSQAADLLRAVLTAPRAAPRIAILPEAAEGEIARLAIQVADDFVFVPIRPAELSYRVMRLLGTDGSAPGPPGTTAAALLEEELAQRLTLAGLIGRDPAFLKTLARVPLVARSAGPILIVGETGTGKDLCARAVHSLSPRNHFPFIPADCATLPDHLFENELFGHASGAYTDARDDMKGLVALAEGGTLFLDEINSLSLVAQAKLLRFLQERAYRPLGSNRFVRSNVTIVAATNCDLEGLVRARQFRPDLLFRLNVFRLDLVPLRERRGDIALLARHFAGVVCAEHGLAPKTLAPATIRRLTDQQWPGNVRELFNTIQRAVIYSQGHQILPADVTDCPDPELAKKGFDTFRQARMRAIESFERFYVENLMRECNGNVSLAARLADKERRAFGRLVKRYGIKQRAI